MKKLKILELKSMKIKNNTESEEKKKGNDKKIKEQRYEKKEEEKNEVNDKEESSSMLSFSIVSLNQKSSFDNNELKIELYPENLPKNNLKKESIKNFLSKETLSHSLDEKINT